MIKLTVPRIVSRNWSHRKKVRAKRIAKFMARTLRDHGVEEHEPRIVTMINESAPITLEQWETLRSLK